MTDFFISYTAIDLEWAEWIASVLETEGYKTILQAWDFQPGSNFVIEMQKAASAARTIMVLSPDYLKSQFTAPEWAAAFKNDPQGLERKLVPVMVRECEPEGMLESIVHIKLMGLEEDEARQRLIAGLKRGRAKPANPPVFPGPKKSVHGNSVEKPAVNPFPLQIKNKPTDLDKRRFAKTAMEAISAKFRTSLDAINGRNGLDAEFQEITALEFTAEIFRSGKSIASCRIVQGSSGFARDGITYAEGFTGVASGFNDILTVAEFDGELFLTAMMPEPGGQSEIDAKKMSADQAARYLWRRFVHRLER